MSSISVSSLEKLPRRSFSSSGFKQDFREMVISLQKGNNPAADAAFEALKLGFQSESDTTSKPISKPCSRS